MNKIQRVFRFLSILNLLITWKYGNHVLECRHVARYSIFPFPKVDRLRSVR